MKQVIQDFKTGDVRVVDVPRPQVDDGSVLVKNHCSCVSAGTEKSMIELGKKSYIGKARERPDLAKKVIEKARNDGVVPTYKSVMSRLEEATPLGYSSCGEVISVGNDVGEFSEGDLVACAGAGYASHAEVVAVPENLCAPVPDGVNPANAAFVTIGAIALQGIRRANPSPGETVAVFGLGLIGQTATQILNAYGFPVLGLDIDERQVDKGLDAGATRGALIGADDLETVVDEFSNGNGVDATLITASTKSNQPIELAGEITRNQGRVSVVGRVGMDIPRDIYYDKELDFRISRSYGPGRYDRNYEEKGLDYPVGHVRWTENRNMRECLRLLATDRVDFRELQTHEFAIDEATQAYDLILNNPDGEDFTGVLLQYDPDREHQTKQPHRSLDRTAEPRSAPLSVGLVGVGTFAKGKLLPTISDLEELKLYATCSATGVSASQVAEKHDCSFSTTDYTDITESDDVDVVVVATRNNLHAQIAAAALENGKDVHVEKPLAISEEGLQRVANAARNSAGRLMVGFNRRFAPPTQKLKQSIASGPGPVMLNYRVNVDELSPDHWLNDPDEGGGRVVGELCHFIDFSRFVADAPIEQVCATTADDGQSGLPQNVDVKMAFENDSTASILYTTLGDNSLAKEYIEGFGNGESATIDNFKSGRFNFGQNKGHEQEFRSFVDAILSGEPSLISLEEAVEVTETTFGVYESLQRNDPVEIDTERYL